MRRRALLIFLVLLFGCKKPQKVQPDEEGLALPSVSETKKPEVVRIAVEDADAVAIVDYPKSYRINEGCEDKRFSNLRCPFARKLTLDYQSGLVTEESCQCFPEVSTRTVTIDENQKSIFRALIRNAIVFDSYYCSYDSPLSSLTAKKNEAVEKVYFALGDTRRCDFKGRYIAAVEPLAFRDAVATTLQNTLPVTESRVRKIYGAHTGFRLTYSLPDPGVYPQCKANRIYLYRAETQEMDLYACDVKEGMVLIRTAKLSAEDNERVLSALKDMEVPTMESDMKLCNAAGVQMEIYRPDGTAETFAFGDPACSEGWEAKYDFRQQVSSPSSAELRKFLYTSGIF